ncbi:MAG TPA: TonB family protein, partial [Polyangiales bacterium]
IRGALIALAWLACAATAFAQKPAPQLTKPPALVRFVEAPYPQVEPKPTGDVGVTLVVLIGADGKVADAKVTQSAGQAFDDAALAAVRQFEFTPAEVDHKPSAINIEYRYVFTQRVEKVVPTTGVLAGLVKDLDKKPVADVKVELASGASTLTDATGHFRFADLPAGKVTLTLSGERLTPLQTEETIVAGEELEVAYKVALAAAPGEPSDDLEILVTAPAALQRDVVSTKVTAAQARSVPGAQGDVVRVVESLPGVARSAVGSGNLVVWGAGPDDTKTYVDGVPIPRLYHEGGLRSTVYAGVVNSVELVPGGYGAAYGRGLGGLLRVETQTPDKVGTHGQLAVDVFDASGMLSQTITPRLRATAAGRVSLIDQFSKALSDDVGEYVPIPRYRDAQLRTSYALKNGDTVDVVGIMSMDHTARGVPNPDPALVTREQRDSAFYRVYARYVHDDGRGARSVITPFVGFGNATIKNRYGSTTTSLGDDDYVVGLRASHTVRAASFLTVEGGLDIMAEGHDVTRRGSLGLPAREGDVRVFGQPPPDSIGYDSFKTSRLSVAPYLEGDFSFAKDKLHIVPGIRVDPNFRSVSRKVPPVAGQPDFGAFAQNFAVEPRLAIRYRPHEKVGLHAATGIYHQQPAVADLSSVFGSPTLGTSRAIHNVLGANVQATKELSIELTGFATFMSDLTMRNTDPAPRNAEALRNSGEGHTYGLQTLIRRELANNVFGWVAYTLMRSERKNADNTPWRLFDFDQTHVLSTVLVWTPLPGFEVGTRFRVASGYPRTAVIGTYYDALRDRAQPVFGAQNDIRIPLFIQLDLRASQTFKLAGTQGQVYLEVQNVTNRQNSEELVYSPDFTRRGSIKSLPILPVAGVSWNF